MDVANSPAPSADISPQDYAAFCEFLEEACGIVLGDNKHYLVKSRLNRLIGEYGLGTFAQLMAELKRGSNRKLRESIIDAMTTNETMWFRDAYPFEILKQHILPELAKQRSPRVRFWSAACSSGQESYSISMAFSEFQLSNPGAFTGALEIVGTDISPSMLRNAREACYDEMMVRRGLSEERRTRFFQRVPRGCWEVKPEVRNRVRFQELNLLQSYALLGKFDVVFCRNVLIYFSSDIKRQILARISQTMSSGAYLFLGGSESPTGYSDEFEMLRMPQGVLYRKR